MHVVMSRSYFPDYTKSLLYVLKGIEEVFNCFTLELPEVNNTPNISCIPAGTYKCEKVTSPSHGYCILVQHVPGRSKILFHPGNFAAGSLLDTKGCILPGSGFADINADGYPDIINSKTTMNKLLEVLPGEFWLTIL